MATLLKIAWRNIWRHKVRSRLIVFSVAFGIWAGLFMQGYVNGMAEGRIRIAIQNELSHLQIHHPAFKKDMEPVFVIHDASGIRTFIEKSPAIKAVTLRHVAKGMVASPVATAGIKINGIIPGQEVNVTAIRDKIIDGDFFPGKSRNEMLMGEKLSRKLKVKTGDKVVITLVDRENNITSGAFRVKGLYRTSNAPYDESNVFVDESTLYPLTTGTPEYNEIAILLKDNKDLAGFASTLKKQYPGLLVESWRELAPELDLTISTVRQSMVIFMGIIMLALAFGIINTMLMAVLERTRELGMLMALGMTKGRIFLMIFYETILLVFTGTPFGVLAGAMTVYYFNVHGIGLSRWKDVYESFGYSDVVRTSVNKEDYWVIIILVVITALVSSLFPARKAVRLNPAEAIRK
ncbi:MAG: ABC transporter permease [Bacteroidia bacterium]|nr:ABC transporter permease [Bacteroidia bacterium]